MAGDSAGGKGGTMGIERGVVCSECGESFTVSEGGGFIFHLLHCEACGEEKSVGFAELGGLHERYVKGLDTPFCSATWESDRRIQRDPSVEPLDKDAYHAEVERMAGGCNCGGGFSFRAKPRCPACGSTRHEVDPDGEMICFD